jgi:hypothetical protein
MRIFVTAQKILLYALRASVFATELTHYFFAKNRGIMIGADTACFFLHLFDFGDRRLARFFGFGHGFRGHDWMLSAL